MVWCGCQKALGSMRPGIFQSLLTGQAQACDQSTDGWAKPASLIASLGAAARSWIEIRPPLGSVATETMKRLDMGWDGMDGWMGPSVWARGVLERAAGHGQSFGF